MEKKPDLNIMVDIETLSTDRERGLMLSVGMKSFDLEGGIPVKDFELDVPIDVLSSILAGRIMDESTINWWRSRPEEQQTELINRRNATIPFKEAMDWILQALNHMAEECTLKMWSKGTDFDFPMIESSMISAGVIKSTDELPYKFWNKYDVRTVINTFKVLNSAVQMPKSEAAHTALEDCEIQIKDVQFCYQNMAK